MWRVTLATASLAVALFFVPQAEPARAADPYEINVILPLTGGGAFLGKGEQQSLQLVEQAINASGGLQGRPLHYVFHDDETNPQTGVQLAGQVLASKPAVVLGSSLVAICRAMAPLMENVAVEYCFSPGVHPQPGSYVFTSSVSTLDLANAQIRYFRMKGLTRIALMFSTDATGQDAEQGFKSILAQPENKAMQLVEVAHFNTSDVSVSAQIANVKAANPQCFVAWSTGSPIATIFRAMLQAGLDVPFATTDGNMTHAQMTQYADFLPKQLYIPAAQWVVTSQAQLSPDAAKAHAEFYKYFDAAKAKPDEPSELAWDAAMIVNHALRTLGTNATAAQLHDFIEKLTGYAGIDGVYDFTKVPQRGLDVSAAVVTRWSETAKTWQVVSKATGVPLE